MSTWLFNVDELRARERRTAFVRTVAEPSLVLGSIQNMAIVDRGAVRREGVTVIRRRSGGGAVLVEPGEAVWIDTWIPRGDPLGADDLMESRMWVGEWWRGVLGAGFTVHSGRPSASRWSGYLCFAGVAAGEVVDAARRKVVGVAQWRAREGVLTHSMAYRSVDWERAAGLLELGPNRTAVAAELGRSTTTLGELGAEPARVAGRLLDGLPSDIAWEVVGG